MTRLLSAEEIMAKLISFPTVSRDTNMPLVEWVAAYLEGQGITPHLWIDPEQPEKAAVFAHVGPMEEGALVLSGHTDVVPVDGQDWDTDPFVLTEKEGRYYGRGTCDMKGFDALAIWAMVEAHRHGISKPLQLALSFDEEIGCAKATPLIEAMAEVLPKGDRAIIGEPSLMTCVTGHKGGRLCHTHVKGFEVHSSLADQGVSAIHEAARLIQWANDMNDAARAAEPSALAALFSPPWTSWHVGHIDGGTAHNIMAGDCQFTMGFRALPEEDFAVLDKVWRDKVSEVEQGMKAINPDCEIRLDYTFGLPPLRPEQDGAAEALVRSITGDNGTHVVSYGTEASHFQAAGYSTVVCGPGNIAQAHQANEWLSVAQFEAGVDFMRSVLERLR